nr:MAG TPA: portal [Caudoviricetes sp.]
MTIADCNSTYLHFIPLWNKCRDIVMGEEKVKAMGNIYLPKPSGMDNEDYEGYKGRAQFFNATGRTLDGLSGMMNRKPPMVTVPKGMEKYLENVDGKGHSLTQFINFCSRENLTTAWGGVLVDMPVNKGAVSMRDFEELNISAYMVYYPAESIINWKFDNNGRQQFLRYVIFKEIVEENSSPYTTEKKERYRVCEIDKTGYYKQTVYNYKGEVALEVYPTNKEGKLTQIPFYFLSSSERPEVPILNDLINVNLSHYRKSADYENGLHWTGVPTPWVQGVDVDEKNGEAGEAKPLKLGGCTLLYLPSGASMQYLEFSGSGCSQLATAMRADEDRMAILGARIISQERNGVEAAETAKIHRAGENSVLAEIAINLSIVFKKILKIYLEWSASYAISDEDIDVRINTDYDVATMSPAELTALVALWQSGGIAKRDLFDNLKNGEILSADRNFDEMNAEIDEEQMAKVSFQNNSEE